MHPLAGPRRGDLRSRQQGVSVEFSDYREYIPGDDERTIDWHIAARTDEFFVRLYEGEENVRVELLIDQSVSMQYGDPSKLDYARSVAAALGYVAVRSGHQVRVISFAEGVANPSSLLHGTTGAVELVRFVSRLQAGGSTSLEESLRKQSLEQPNPGVTFILSDWYNDDSWQSGITALRATGRIIYLCHILSPQELQPMHEGAFEWIDAESGQRLALSLDARTLQLYDEALHEWIEGIRSFCSRQNVRYLHVPTTTSLEDLLIITLRKEGVIR